MFYVSIFISFVVVRQKTPLPIGAQKYPIYFFGKTASYKVGRNFLQWSALQRVAPIFIKSESTNTILIYFYHSMENS